MSQILGFLTIERVYLCADSGFFVPGQPSSNAVKDKLFLGDSYIVTTAGVAFGTDIIAGMIHYCKKLGAASVEDLGEYLMTFGQKQYEEFLKQYRQRLDEQYLRIYFMIGGSNSRGALALKLYGSEGARPIREVNTGEIVTAPRRIALELKLLRMKNEPASVITNTLFSAFRALSQSDETVRPPFLMGILDRHGKTFFERSYN